LGTRKFEGKVEALAEEIKACLATGVGSSDIKSFEILNDL
jgi:hypothetical protein